ncbi:type 1 pili tip component [Spectribacter hydrogenoxidans]|uniref:Type 1 pili tip component n=1 Tax=Spectribacter hydrogenoxidans TaxID=3075608 RepID=A0ABU3C2D4_9GAMM|nr:type 1 pili tip component [Salinisphaera sp. W335]MDT0635541.1 type 1 pili tip component [Salinisphaera sp. W335]
MKVTELIEHWRAGDGEPRAAREYRLRLPVYDAAKVAALTELFPGLTEERILTDLLSAALDDLSASFAYVEGNDVVARDEEGDPIYADAGLTPRFHEAARRHADALKRETEGSS